jgi:hypothetical protein
MLNHGELSSVDNVNKVLATQTGKPVICESCCELPLSTALQVDDKLKHQGRDPKRQINFASACAFVDNLPECGIDMSASDMLTVHETKLFRNRMSGAQWHDLLRI